MSDIIRKLQQRIDKRSNYITTLEEYINDPDQEWLTDDIIFRREEQTLDKRIMGELIWATRRARVASASYLRIKSAYRKLLKEIK